MPRSDGGWITDDSLAELKILWAEGFSTAEIGRRLGCSKNSIVGKAIRMGLDPRPSPIRRDPPKLPPPLGPSPEVAPAPKITLPPLASAPRPDAAPRPVVAAPEPAPIPLPAPAPQPLFTAPPRPVVPEPPRYLPIGECCWPIGEAVTTTFPFCEATPW